MTVICGGCGGGGGAAGTPAEPPISAGLGKDSLVVPLSAPSIVDFQMSLSASVSPSWVVPVLDADGRPPARLCPREYPAIGCIADVTLSATSLGIRCSPELSELVASNSTFPSALTTFCTKCGL